jgi:hypothetical protein
MSRSRIVCGMLSLCLSTQVIAPDGGEGGILSLYKPASPLN